jgi:calcium/calmodulin-dependent protein kinase I
MAKYTRACFAPEIVLFRDSVYSRVYIYKPPKPHSPQVIKTVKKPFIQDGMNEVKMLRYLQNSPYVVNLEFTYLIEDKNHHDSKTINIVLEYCENGCMYDNHTMLLESQVKKAVKSFLMCILECHKHMIIHGDIKLSNFVVDKAFNTKLIDFGCSRFVKTCYEAVESSQATWFYAAPETMRSLKYMQSDMWSLGICAYYLIAGMHPFENPDNFWKGIINTDNKQFLNLSPDGKDFILSLLKIDPFERLTSFEAINHPFLV